MRTLEACPVCLHTEHQPFLKVKDHSTSGEWFQLQQCSQCGMVWTDPVPDEHEIGPYYASADYISHTDSGLGLVGRVYKLVRGIALGQKSGLVINQTGRSKGSLLDIGAGTGAFVQHMGQLGWEVSGLEPSEQARAVAQAKGLNLLPPEQLFELPDTSLHAISLWHVLEHVHRLDEYWQAFDRLLKPSGRLFIALPNRSSWDAQHYGADWAAWDVPIHLYHFRPQDIVALAARHGFELVHQKGMPFDPYYVALLSEKYRQSSAVWPRALWAGLVSSAMAWKDLERNSSLIYVFRKR